MKKIKKIYLKKRVLFYLKFLLLCAAAGIGSGLFSLVTDKTYLLFKSFYQFSPYSVLIYTPLVFCLIVFLFKHYFPYAGGSGLSQGYALEVYERSVLENTYSLRTMFGKILLTFMSISAGASLGREGPLIQICASIFGSMKNLSLHRKKLLIRIGSGIGVATAFNAPLGGIIFVLEEYLKISKGRINGFLLVGVGLAGYVMIQICGDYSYMGQVSADLLFDHEKSMLVAIIAGVLCGLMGALFTWLMVYVSVNKGQAWQKFRQKHYLLWTIIFGLGLAIVGLLSSGYAFGNGAVETKYALSNGLNLPWYYGLAKALGTICSVAANVPGGYFSTALSIGAGIMDTVYRIWPVLPVEQFYMLGMVGFLAAITNAPITAVAMMMSIVIDSQYFLLPLCITSFLASAIANRFGDSVYHQQVMIYISRERYRETR